MFTDIANSFCIEACISTTYFAQPKRLLVKKFDWGHRKIHRAPRNDSITFGLNGSGQETCSKGSKVVEGLGPIRLSLRSGRETAESVQNSPERSARRRHQKGINA